MKRCGAINPSFKFWANDIVELSIKYPREPERSFKLTQSSEQGVSVEALSLSANPGLALDEQFAKNYLLGSHSQM